MTSTRDALRPPADAGMTLIEVVVALLVFAIVAVGIVGGLVTITHMTGDNRSRVIAANLAAGDIDLARAIGDPFKITGATSTRLISGRTYTIKRTVSWVSQAGQDISCGSATNLFFLRVHAAVTWTGQLLTTGPVVTDTLIAPDGRVTDPTSGTVAVAVTGADGLPMAGVTVTIVPTAGGRALVSQPAATGEDGCTYATKVAPGVYSVSVSRTGFVDTTQDATPSKPVTVVVGGTASASFQFDAGATFPVTYAKNYTAGPAALPTNLDTTFINSTAGLTLLSPSAASVVLHPFPSGYTAVAGALGATGGTTTCASVDPAAWGAGKVGAVQLLAGARAASVAAAPGGTAPDLDIPMGVVIVKATGPGWLKAVSALPTRAGNPGCITGRTYSFGNVLKNGSVAVALPYGSWTLYSGNAAAQITPVPAADLDTVTNAAPGGVTGPGSVTLDPRAP